MWAAAVVESEIAADPGAGLRDAGVGPQVDLFVFDGPPEALDEDVVAPGALTHLLPAGDAKHHREAC